MGRTVDASARPVQLLALAGCVAALSACGSSSGSSSSNPPVVTVAAPSRTVTYNVPSASMEPTLHCAQPDVGCQAAVSDGAVTQEPASDVKRGNIVVFQTPALAQVRCGAGGKFIKRVIGMPGDRWEERNGYVYIDGKKLDEPYVTADRRDERTIRPLTVPPNSYFMMGDNRDASCDSREWGTVPARNLIGKVVKIVRPQ